MTKHTVGTSANNIAQPPPAIARTRLINRATNTLLTVVYTLLKLNIASTTRPGAQLTIRS